MDERKAFVEWARQVRVWDVDPPEAVLMAWKAATLAERERAAKVCEAEAAKWRGEQDITDFKLCAQEIRKG